MTAADDRRTPTIANITEAAAIAAARGEWNRVEAYYQRRELLLSQEVLSPEALAQVLAMDRRIEEQVRVAQGGLASLLEEAAKTRQRIQGLRRWSGAMSSDSGTIERHV